MPKKSPVLQKWGVLLLLVSLFVSYGYSPVPQTEVKSSGVYSPTGIIAMWSGAINEIPEGWGLCDGIEGPQTDGNFIFNTNGVANPGTTGGSIHLNHTYNRVPEHDHGMTSIGEYDHYHNYERPSSENLVECALGSTLSFDVGLASNTSAEQMYHDHYTDSTGSSNCRTSDTTDINPPYTTLAFIEKKDPNAQYPAGLIVMWTGELTALPDGWLLCNGSDFTPDLRSTFIKGTTANPPGEIGGNTTHSHNYIQLPRHNHDISSVNEFHNHSLPYSATMGVSTIFPMVDVLQADWSVTSYDVHDTHTHDIDPFGQEEMCQTEEASHLPPYTTVGYLMNNQPTQTLPVGVSVFWGGQMGEIPTGYTQCNGTQGTLDLRSKFLRGWSTGEPIGYTAGSATHSHTYYQLPLHDHNLGSDSLNYHDHPYYRPIGVISAMSGTGAFFPTQSTYSYTDYSDTAHVHDVDPYGYEGPYTDSESNFPPYIELTVIQRTSPATTIDWLFPIEGQHLHFPRTPYIVFDFDFTWSGLATDVTLSMTNESHFTDVGSIWGMTKVPVEYLDGNVTAVLHILYEGIELTNDSRYFTFSNNHNPTVEIFNLTTGNRMYGTWLLEWEGNDADGDPLNYTLQYNVEDTGWQDLISNTTSTSFLWDTTTVAESDFVDIRVTVTDSFGGQKYHQIDNLSILQPTTELEWIFPANGAIIRHPRSPQVVFNFNYAWEGLGDDITLTLSNGTHSHNAGSVMGKEFIAISYLDGPITASLHLWYGETEYLNATRHFVFTNNRDPTVTLLNPIPAEIINGAYEVKWGGSDPDYDPLHYRLEYNLDNSGWALLVANTSATSFLWDTTVVENSDMIRLLITCEDNYGGYCVAFSAGDFSINNTALPPGETPSNDNLRALGYFGLGVVASGLSTVSYILLKKRNQKKNGKNGDLPQKKNRKKEDLPQKK